MYGISQYAFVEDAGKNPFANVSDTTWLLSYNKTTVTVDIPVTDL